MNKFNMLFTTALFGAVFSLGVAQSASANVADDLNANYNNTIQNCGSKDDPAYECSGNLMRFTKNSTNYHAWNPSKTSVNKNSQSFTYMRKDISFDLGITASTFTTSGIIYYPSDFTSSLQDKADITCFFPTDAMSDLRIDNRCGATTVYPVPGIACQDQGIYTSDVWYNKFINNIGLAAKSERGPMQCGFNMSLSNPNITNRAQDFYEGLKSEMKLNANPEQRVVVSNEIVIKNAPVVSKTTDLYEFTNPEKLPIQAFFYLDLGGVKGLSDAQAYQKDYYQKTSVVIPIVKVNTIASTEGGGTVHKLDNFSYNPEDRGVTIADELNANYNKVIDSCGSANNPSYQCSGILLRQTSDSSAYHVWDPSSKSIQYKGVSFSYLRKDIKIRSLMQTARNSGFIYYPTQQAPQTVTSEGISCAFPGVAMSDMRPDGRCGSSTVYPTSSGECQQQGITTADAWYKHFSEPGVDPYSHQCGFNVSNAQYNTVEAFNEFIKAHNIAYANSTAFGNGIDEVIVRTQDTDASGKSINPEKLPLQAFFYNNAKGLTEAQNYQQDYYNVTGRIVPVVYMNTTDFNNISFEYKTTDQVDLKKKGNVAAELTANYNKVVDNCGSEASPAFACSGNIIRFTNYSTEYRVWNPSPAAATRKGISFMYVRQDLPLDKTFKDKGSGLIYYPTEMMPASKELSPIRCAFPVDGYSDRRYTNGQNDACGTNINYPNNSQPCQEQGITTGQGWYDHFSSIPDVDKNRLNHQCGFSLANTEQNQASIFKAALDGQKLLQDARGSASYNELVLSIPSYNASYQIDNPAVLPIEAFFYTNDSGLTEARGYQQDYHDYAHVDAPIVKLDLDITTGAVTYSYNKADQTDAYNQAN